MLWRKETPTLKLLKEGGPQIVPSPEKVQRRVKWLTNTQAWSFWKKKKHLNKSACWVFDFLIVGGCRWGCYVLRAAVLWSIITSVNMPFTSGCVTGRMLGFLQASSHPPSTVLERKSRFMRAGNRGWLVLWVSRTYRSLLWYKTVVAQYIYQKNLTLVPIPIAHGEGV